MSCDVSRLRYRGGSFSCLPCRFAPSLVPHPHHLVLAPRHRPVIPFPRLAACLARWRRLAASSSHPSSLTICLLAVPSCGSSSSRLFDPFSRWPLPTCPIVPRACPCLRLSIAPLCLSHGWERDGAASLSRHRLPALPPLLAWRVSRLRAFPRCGLLCLLGCRRLCRYCDGEIIYMICPVDII